MLVLSRKRSESIVVGGPCVLTVLDIRGDNVRLGLDADVNVPIHRREVYDALQAAHAAAANGNKPVGKNAV